MVQHIIIWKLKEEFNTQELKENMKKGIEGLLGVVPGLNQIKFEINPLSSSNADVMLYSEFETKEALEAYATHPEHVKVANELVRPYVGTKACFDYKE